MSERRLDDVNERVGELEKEVATLKADMKWIKDGVRGVNNKLWALLVVLAANAILVVFYGVRI